MSGFAATIARAAIELPMCQETHEGRVLLADGDALAYACSGAAGTSPGQARTLLAEKVRSAQKAAGCDSTRILLTARDSHKGHRYAVARVKPYQAQRSSGRRPDNWLFLRTILEDGLPGYVTDSTNTAEADDLWGKYSTSMGPENVVILTQDKDGRMVPGYHMVWADHTLIYVAPDTWEHVHADKVYGRKWFWLQMLHGDNADNIPGLPKYINPKGNLALCGEVTAGKLLADCANEAEARSTVLGLYRGYYGDDAWMHLLEQGILLWMRNDPNSSAMNVLAPGNPFGPWAEAMVPARAEMMQRIAEAQV